MGRESRRSTLEWISADDGREIERTKRSKKKHIVDVGIGIGIQDFDCRRRRSATVDGIGVDGLEIWRSFGSWLLGIVVAKRWSLLPSLEEREGTRRGERSLLAIYLL